MLTSIWRKILIVIIKQENTGLKYCKDARVFIEYWNDMDDIYKKIEE